MIFGVLKLYRLKHHPFVRSNDFCVIILEDTKDIDWGTEFHTNGQKSAMAGTCLEKLSCVCHCHPRILDERLIPSISTE